ncbi:MAG: protein-methionine-sulfoxide reductase catalytic subunit MsrP [Chloroflexi bacterium]|nr:protein-methionine-sulfoxide reductase catalytic subunit MsrP [Chloroflexota bacterium]
MKKIPSSEITPEYLYLSRRKFIKNAGMAAAVTAFLAACGGKIPFSQSTSAPSASSGTLSAEKTDTPDYTVEEPNENWNPVDDPLTDYESITNYNNYYEFTTDKNRVAELSANFITDPWQVEVTGLVANPRTFSMEELLKFEQEESIYRLRCVEAWSMVIPWIGFPLSKLLKEVQPSAEAKYVQFTTAYDPQQMPGTSYPYPWPYKEGLRLDEAMHDLTILATGLYGKTLLPQNGAPVRLAVPWKYGFKSIKSIVKIELVTEMPVSLWMAIAPQEYGFYANVNPNVNHPRWSQATERRIGENGRRETLLFNGYEDEVAGLYAGMDLSEWY